MASRLKGQPVKLIELEGEIYTTDQPERKKHFMRGHYG